MSTATVPSAYAFFRVMRTRPSGQIYFRYQRGQTRNPAFRNFWMFVTYLGWRCRRVIRKAGAWQR